MEKDEEDEGRERRRHTYGIYTGTTSKYVIPVMQEPTPSRLHSECTGKCRPRNRYLENGRGTLVRRNRCYWVLTNVPGFLRSTLKFENRIKNRI